MTNPDNAVGTNGAYGGRTSVNAFNDIASMFYSRGRVSGWGVVPSSGMTVAVGGGSDRDVAIARDNSFNFTTVNNISGAPIQVEIAAAPSSGNRYDAIIVYVDNPPQGEATVIDNPMACGILAVQGTTSGPTEADIRAAITADGASGSTAYYCHIATIKIPANTTTISSNLITAGYYANLKAHIAGYRRDGSVTYSSGWADYSGSSKINVWRIGDTVSVSAIFKNTSDWTSSTSDTKIAQINESWLFPPSPMSGLGQGSGANKFYWRIGDDGAIAIGRYGTTATNTQVSSGAFFSFSASYASNSNIRYM